MGRRRLAGGFGTDRAEMSMTTDSTATQPALARGPGNTGFAMHLALLLLRVGLGAVFVFHGSQKVFDGLASEKFLAMMQGMGLPLLPPAVWAGMAAWSELLGGGLVLVGLLTRLAAVPLIVTMLVAIATVTGKNGFDSMNHGYEYNIVLLAMAGALVLCGGGL